MGMHSIHCVQMHYPAGLEAEVRQFYAGLLGLTPVLWPAGPALCFAARGQRVDLLPLPADAHTASAHLAFEVVDLPHLRGRLLDAALQIEESEPLPGYLRFFVKDPAGNQLEFIEPDVSQASLA